MQIVGPVVLKLANGLSINGTLGSGENPEWLDLQIAQGGLTVNGNGAVHGVVTAPNGAVSINGAVHGRVNADQLRNEFDQVLRQYPPTLEAAVRSGLRAAARVQELLVGL